MTASQYLRFTQRRYRPRIDPPTDEWIAAQLAHSKGRPYWGDTIRSTGDGAGGDEVDDGYLAAIRLAPRTVGLADGEVPMAVADRLYDAGLVRKVE